MTTHREVVSTNLLAIGIKNITGRHHVAVLRLGDNLLGQTSCIVGLCTICKTFLHIVEAQCTGIFCNNNSIERVPLGNLLALFNYLAVLMIQ